MRKNRLLRAMSAAATPVLAVVLAAACGSITNQGPQAGGAHTKPAQAADTCGGYSWCTTAPAGGDNNAPAPQASGTDCGGFSWCTAAPAQGGGGAQPLATADAGPIPKQTAESSGGGDCSFYYYPNDSGLEVDSHVQIIGSVDVSCDPAPRALSVSVTIYWLPPRSKLYAAVGFDGSTYPGTALTHPTEATAPCQAGLHYLEMHAVGVSASGKSFNAHVIGATVEVPASLCA